MYATPFILAFSKGKLKFRPKKMSNWIYRIYLTRLDIVAKQQNKDLTNANNEKERCTKKTFCLLLLKSRFIYERVFMREGDTTRIYSTEVTPKEENLTSRFIIKKTMLKQLH